MLYYTDEFEGDIKVIEEIKKIVFSAENKEIEKLYKDMSRYQRRIFDGFKENPEEFVNYSLNDLVFDFDAEFVEKILEIELNAYIRESNKKGIENKRNGSTKDITIIMGNKEINFNRPRARKETEFDSELIPKRTKIMDDMSDDIILLYSKNNTIRDIKEILKGMFGLNISEGKISMLAQELKTEVINWRNRELEKCYFTLNIDCTYIKIRDEKHKKSHKIPVYIIIGTKLDGHKEVCGIYLGNEDADKNIIDELSEKNIGESKNFWQEVFLDLKDRGIKDTLYVISDGLKGIEEVIKEEYPKTKYQYCIVHMARNVKKYAGEKNSKNVMKDLKKIYSAPTKEIAESEYNIFIEKYKRKKKLVQYVEKNYRHIESLYECPENIRKYIYTNNIIESANSKVKRGFYGRGALPNIESAINIIYLNLKDLEEKWKTKKVTNWDKIFNEINICFNERIKKYL